MKQQEVFRKIGGIIREINEQYEYLETTDGIYNDLELELMIANSHFLSDHIEILRKLSAQAPPVQLPPPAPLPLIAEKAPEAEPAPPVPATPEPSFFVPVTAEEPEPEEEPIAYIDETPNTHVFEFEIPRQVEDHVDHFPEPEAVEEAMPEPEPETIRHELTLEDIGEDWDEEEDPEEVAAVIPEPVAIVAEPEPEPTPEPVKAAVMPAAAVEPEPISEPEPESVAEAPEVKPAPAPQPVVAPQHTQIMVPEDQVITLNQRMSAQMGGGSRMSDHLSAQPISDLKSAISLNDKLMYIKDLFNGYGLAYSEAIDHLNRMQSFAEAEGFLKSNYATKNHWDDKQTTADKFFAVLQRRYV
jgi:hypothetical protein